MLDRISLDQLRTFIAAVDEGSFSAAGRRLKRAQSMVSQTLANLEGQLGVRLFDRGPKGVEPTRYGLRDRQSERVRLRRKERIQAMDFESCSG